MITIIWKLNNFEIAGFGNMTIIHMTKKNYIFPYQLSHTWRRVGTCPTPVASWHCSFQTTAKAGPQALSRIKEAEEYWFLPASIERPLLRIGVQHECIATKASSLFLESPLSLLIREMLNPQKRRSLRKMTKFSCLIHVGQPMNPAHSSQVCTFIHTEMSDGIRLQIISLPSHLIQHIFQ